MAVAQRRSLAAVMEVAGEEAGQGSRLHSSHCWWPTFTMGEMVQIEHLEENLEIMTGPASPRGLHSSSLIFASQQHRSCFPFIGQKLALSSIIGKL